MDFLTKNIRASRYDLKRNIILPNKMTPKLAEVIGIIIGDGNIYMKDNRYELHFYGDINEDKEYHNNIVLKLLEKLFNIKATSKEKYFRYNCRRIDIESKAITSFLTETVGLKSGKKKDIAIPDKIYNGKNNIICSFLRGLADTDFSIKFKTRYGKKNYYPIIIGHFSDKLLVYQLKDLLEKVGFHSHIEKRKKYDKISKKQYKGYSINIVGKANIDRWMKNIGFNNKRHLIRYNVWKEIGFCPPYTNIIKGESILKKDI